MADRSGLKLLGFIFASVTLAVMLATGMVVKGYVTAPTHWMPRPSTANSLRLH